MSPTQQRTTSELTGPVNHPRVADSPIRVLLVDDDEAFVELVGEYLEREHGFTVVTKTHAEDALEYLNADEPVDCLVSDYQMPDMDGLDLLETVSDRHPELQFVMFAGQGSEEVASKAIQRGADDYLQKDTGETRYELLARRIRNCVTIARQQTHLQNLYAAIEDAGHAMLVTNRQGTITYVNPTMVELSGYERNELIGETLAVLKSGVHGQEFYQDIWETVLAGDVWEGEVVNERKDGSQYIIDQTIAPITDVDDQITGFVAINSDSTARKRRERDLTFLKEAIDQAGIGIGTYGRDGYSTYVNTHLTELFETTPEELEQYHIADLTTDLDRQSFKDYWESFDVGERRVYETTIQQVGSGMELPVEIVSSRVLIEEEPYQVTSVRDITERKERERELERFRSAVDHAGHGVVITDTDGTIEYVNEAFETTTGYSATEVVGETPTILKSGEHDQEFYRELWETILDGEVWQGEVINERKDGTHYIVDQTIAPLSTDGGGIEGFVAINRDITQLKEYERELEKQNDRLKEYGHTVAHDLRNPLGLIEHEIDQLRSDIETGKTAGEATTVQEHCSEIEDVLAHMGRLIDDLLTMAEQGQHVLAPEQVSLKPVAEDAWKQIVAPTLWETDDSTDAQLTVEDTTLNADPDRLHELLSNLFRNAIEHGAEDVHVRVGPLDFETGFFVEDDGPGIPPEDHEQIFDRGYTTSDEGTGFGLAIVTQIATAHDWEVVVTDSADNGARFEFHGQDAVAEVNDD